MTGVREGGGVLERSTHAGSSPCRKDLTLFVSIILPFAETLNQLRTVREANEALRVTSQRLK